MNATTTPQARRSLIPYLFFAFFGVVFAVNGLMIWLAVTTFSGLETVNAYDKGLAYNDTLAAVRRQEALGWTTRVRLGLDTLVLDAVDAGGEPIRDAAVVAKLVRPADANLDRIVILTETAPGHYEAPVGLPAGGLWLVRSEVRGNGDAYFASDRVVVR